MTRPSWDDYFLEIARVVATRATCDRKHVGAVIVKDKRIVATGYNGSPSGLPHCDEVGHQLATIDGRDSCIRTLHAESNAIDQAGQDAEGGTLYTTVFPCFDCAKRIINAGIVQVIYEEYYESRKTPLVRDLFAVAQEEVQREKAFHGEKDWEMLRQHSWNPK
jgi:dCMP deaminase